MSAMGDMQCYVGTLVHSTTQQPMAVLPQALLLVQGSKIVHVGSRDELVQLQQRFNFSQSQVTTLTPSQFLMPGLVDTHIHAPQFPNNGIHLDLPLLEWLQRYTFPTEAKFADTTFATKVYTRLVDRLLRCGTTTASYFGSVHVAATRVLADVVAARGQRALVGKVNMLRNCPDYYVDSGLEESINLTEQFIASVKDMKNPLVQPIVTPRFAPTCPEDQLARLGELAAKHHCHVQSHLCETQPEVKWVKELFEGAKSYTHVYDDAGLLTPKTVMAHCVWLSEEEVQLLKARGTGVSHCPNSNTSIRSGVCDVRRLLDAGLKVGLGTDCSGGYSASLLDSLRQAVQVSKILSSSRDAYQHLTLAEVFRLATLGGAEVLALSDVIGNFESGKDMDALLVDVDAPDTPLDIFEEDTMEEKVEKFLYNGDDRNIVRVLVSGRTVSERRHTDALCT